MNDEYPEIVEFGNNVEMEISSFFLVALLLLMFKWLTGIFVWQYTLRALFIIHILIKKIFSQKIYFLLGQIVHLNYWRWKTVDSV